MNAETTAEEMQQAVEEYDEKIEQEKQRLKEKKEELRQKKTETLTEIKDSDDVLNEIERKSKTVSTLKERNKVLWNKIEDRFMRGVAKLVDKNTPKSVRGISVDKTFTIRDGYIHRYRSKKNTKLNLGDMTGKPARRLAQSAASGEISERLEDEDRKKIIDMANTIENLSLIGIAKKYFEDAEDVFGGELRRIKYIPSSGEDGKIYIRRQGPRRTQRHNVRIPLDAQRDPIQYAAAYSEQILDTVEEHKEKLQNEVEKQEKALNTINTHVGKYFLAEQL